MGWPGGSTGSTFSADATDLAAGADETFTAVPAGNSPNTVIGVVSHAANTSKNGPDCE